MEDLLKDLKKILKNKIQIKNKKMKVYLKVLNNKINNFFKLKKKVIQLVQVFNNQILRFKIVNYKLKMKFQNKN